MKIVFTEIRFSLLEQDKVITLVTRQGHKDMAFLPVDELSSILETLHLLKSPKNAARLHEAIAESVARDESD